MSYGNNKIWTDFQVQRASIDQEAYPRRIKELSDIPKEIYYRGKLDNSLLENCIAIVGSRAMTRYGRLVTEKIVSSLVQSGVTIISGFMYGIDAVAHRVAVQEKGRTIAVLGSGINQIYPPDHDSLYTQILRENGVAMSEFKPEQKPKPWMYAKRNRIVAALANLGVIVIEASVKSGSLITADYANKLHRTVYAVPGSINSTASEGTNWLIKTGNAKLITSADDIKGIKKIKSQIKTSTQLSPVKNEILEILKKEGTPLAMDELVVISGLSVVEVSKQLTMMNLQGLIDEVNGKYAVKS